MLGVENGVLEFVVVVDCDWSWVVYDWVWLLVVGDIGYFIDIFCVFCFNYRIIGFFIDYDCRVLYFVFNCWSLFDVEICLFGVECDVEWIIDAVIGVKEKIMFDYEILCFIWWLLIGVILVVFMIFDGFDMGIGCLLLLVVCNDDECWIVINSVGVYWEGN